MWRLGGCGVMGWGVVGLGGAIGLCDGELWGCGGYEVMGWGVVEVVGLWGYGDVGWRVKGLWGFGVVGRGLRRWWGVVGRRRYGAMPLWGDTVMG